MDKQLKRVALLTSGGDAPGMNAAIRSVVLAAHHFHIEVLGFFHGYNGLLDNDPTLLDLSSVNDIIRLGGTILKSARCPEFQTPTGLKQAANTLVKQHCDALIVIGGDGSFTGMLALKQYWNGQLIGIPGTIDNDIDGSDATIGFSTAVNTAISAIDKIRDTANAFERIFIVELMGRHSGHITFNVGVACAAEQVLSFENFSADNQKQTLKQLAQEINSLQQTRHNSYIMVIAENVWPGGATALARELKIRFAIDSTACVLGHIQRGGSPDAKDRVIATKMGVAAVQALINGESDMMIAEQNSRICSVPLEQAIQHQKKVNPNLVAAHENILALTAQNQC
ncbi:6-phosphofructokinase [Thalassomonas haliotis]|uniref:6-phosphofructokinase n=1 Tax=Thalassomonas haliotis TaxID=485448 RepID=A0ABY7V7T0_9GAMM|nr:ATP-dependent 6-phosphofructokinase [Thalassomonas haliotis]WDE09671.1 6-phosphofructokinase [Thalassomonas haliotis]